MNNTIEVIENTDESLFRYLDQIDDTKKMLSETLGKKVKGEVTEQEVEMLSDSFQNNIKEFEDEISTLKSKIEYFTGKKTIENRKKKKINKIKETLPLISKIKEIAYSDQNFDEKIGTIMRELAEIDPEKNINVFSLSTVSSELTRDMREYAERKLKGQKDESGQKSLATIIGMDDEKAWEIREKYFTKEAYYKEDEDNEWMVDMLEIYLDTLQGIDTPQAWEIREEFFNYKGAKPRSRSRNNSSLYDSTVARYDGNFEIPGLLRSLGTINTPRAWEMREEVLSKLEDIKDNSESKFSYNLLFSVLRSLKGIDTDQARDMRKRILDLTGDNNYAYRSYLQSLVGLDSNRAWDMRDKIFEDSNLLATNRDIESVCYYLAGLDGDRAWKLRLNLIERGFISAVVGSLGRLDSDRAWKIRLFCLRNAIDIDNVLVGMSGGSYSI